MIVQAGYDIPYNDDIIGVYYDSEDEDKEYDDPPILSKYIVRRIPR